MKPLAHSSFIHSFIHSFWPCPNLDLQGTMQEKRRSILSFKKIRVYNTNDLSLKSDQKSASMCVCVFKICLQKKHGKHTNAVSKRPINGLF
jgi:hypothetical protein